MCFFFIEIELTYSVVLFLVYSRRIQLYIFFFFHVLFYSGLSQDMEYISLSYAAGPCCSSVPYEIVCIC